MKLLLVGLLVFGSVSAFSSDVIKKDYPNLCAITLDYGFLKESKKLSNNSAISLEKCVKDFKDVFHKYDSSDLKRVKFEFMKPIVTACPGEKYSACLKYTSSKENRIKLTIDELSK